MGPWLASGTAMDVTEAVEASGAVAETAAPEEAASPTFSEALVQAEQAALADRSVDVAPLEEAFAKACAAEGEGAPDRVMIERYVRTLLVAAPEKLPAALAAMRTSPSVLARLVGSEVESALALTGRFAEAERKVRGGESIEPSAVQTEAFEWLAAHPDSFAGRLVVDRYMSLELAVWSSVYRKRWVSFADSPNASAAEFAGRYKSRAGLTASTNAGMEDRMARVSEEIRRRRADRRAKMAPLESTGKPTPDVPADEASGEPTEAPTVRPEGETPSSDSAEASPASAADKPVPAASARQPTRITEIADAMTDILEVPKALAFSRAQAVASWGLSERRWEQMRPKAPTAEAATPDEPTGAPETSTPAGE